MTIKKEWETKETSEHIIKQIKCDWCGKYLIGKELNKKEWGTITICFGYGSKHDGTYESEICDNCFNNKIIDRVHQTQ